MAYAQLFGRDDQVTVKNPLNRDYIFQWDGRKYLIRANAKQPMAGWMAEHYVKEMTNLLMQKAGKQDDLMREKAREPYYKMLVISHSKMAPLEGAKDDNEITVLGEDTVAGVSSAPSGKKGLVLADAGDDLIDKELNVDDLPKDDDLYPDPKKKKGGKKAGKPAAKDDDDLEPGELAADAAAETIDGEDDDLPEDPATADEEAFPEAAKA